MPLTGLQRIICRLIADRLRSDRERYVAGGVALNLLAGGERLSRDLDLFHDTAEALRAGFLADRAGLEAAGLEVTLLADSPGYREAVVSSGNERTIVQWSRDSAFRFFPLIEHDLLGLTLHPFDLATNKLLALAGRLEPRDWVDLLACVRAIQPLGYLIWAACGKDPGYSPGALLSAARRAAYSQVELDELAFEGPPPRADRLGKEWHDAVEGATGVIEQIPSAELGTCVLEADGTLCCRDAAGLAELLRSGRAHFHRGSIKGVYPTFP